MSEAIKKPYELSLWADVLETSQDKSKSYYKEIKVATIGSDKMNSPNSAFNIVLTENINGEKTLSFSIRHRYFDPIANDEIENQFVKYLNNERKVKLHYNNKWYDFIIRESEETTEEHTFSYTAQDLFALELGKVGYNVVFNNELNNNQGTVIELAKKTLESTDWEVDEKNSDLFRQKVKEPLYECTITKLGANFGVLNVDTNEKLEDGDIEQGETIYVFYSYIANKNNSFIQFIREKDRKNFRFDSEEVITSTNYRIISEATFEEEDSKVTKIIIGDTEITVDETYKNNQAFRLVYSQITVLDPVLNRVVNLYQTNYKDTIQDIYSYTDYQYVTSSVLTSYVTAGTDFSVLEGGQIQGWDAAVPSATKVDGKSKMAPLNITTYPPIIEAIDLSKIDNFANIRSFLELKFNNIYDDMAGTDAYFNSGPKDNSVMLDHIAAGEQFVLRIKYGISETRHGQVETYDELDVGKGVRALVAQYEVKDEDFVGEDEEVLSLRSYNILNDSIVLNFTDKFQIINNYIEGGTFDSEERLNYIINNVVQTPSTKYCYKVEGDDTEYVWDGENNKYVPKNKNNFLNYYATTATATHSLSSEFLNDPTIRIGLFLYTKDGDLVGEKEKYIYVEDVQLTRYYDDGKGEHKPATIGNIPEAQSIETSYYYLKPTSKTNNKAINLYGKLSDLASEIGINVGTITPIYNDKCEKILSIEESQSNCFNILQSLCETFECWLEINVQHDDSGAISVDNNGNPIKKVAFKEYAGKDNFAGFKYGINLESISRTIDSNEFVTKLIVDQVNNENIDGGTLTIQDAKSNYSKESYILNFSHYLNTGLIQNREECNGDVLEFYEKIRALNELIYNAEKEKSKLSTAVTASKSNITVLETTVQEAELMYNKALADFETTTGMTYPTYVKKYNAKEEGIIDLLSKENVADIIGEIYTSAVTINNYTGIVQNLKKEYNKLALQYYGAKEYEISITTAPDSSIVGKYTTQIIINDYVEGFDFTLKNEQKNEAHFVSTLNKRSFTAMIENNQPYIYCVVNKLPEGYNLLCYDEDNDSYVLTEADNINLVIYSSSFEGTITKKYKFVPSETMEEEYPNLDKIINKALEDKKEIEKSFYRKYSRFIQEGTWSSNNHLDPELYYLDALQVSRTSGQPKVTYNIEVNEISELEDYRNYYFEVGDKTYVEDVEFFGSKTTIDEAGKEFITPNKEEIIISKIEWHLDEIDKDTITVQNYKTRFEDLFQRISATVQTVQYNEITYPKTSSILGIDGLINQSLLLNSWNGANKTSYSLSNDNAVIIEPDGILVKDLTKTSNLVKIKSGGIKVSSDGGDNWFGAIDGEGVKADVLTAGTINTQHISLLDGNNPSFRWDKNGISAYGFNENKASNTEELYDFNTYVRLDKYGLYGMKNGENFVVSSLEEIKEKASFGLTWDGFFIKNSYTNGYVSIDSDEDFQVVTLDESEEIEIKPPILQEVELNSIEGYIDFPYTYGTIIKVYNNDEHIEITDYTYENGVIFVGENINNTFKISYIIPLNIIDLGGRGIMSIDSIQVNGNDYTDSFDYNRENGVLIFPKEFIPEDIVTIKYQLERIKIGATNFVDGAPSKYGIEVRNRLGETVFETNDNGDLSVTGTINAKDGIFRGTVYAENGEFNGHIRATSGEFPGLITVGNNEENYVIIKGDEGEPFIASGNYLENNQEGWIIDGKGDAIFNNVSVRASIRTSVFEKDEIQTVGGAFLFRPSDTIEKAKLREVEGRTDLVLTMKQGSEFKVGDYCKIGEPQNLSGKLIKIYMVSEVSKDGKTIVLEGAGEIFKERS